MMEARTTNVPDSRRPALVLLGLWIGLGLALAASGVLSRAPQAGPAFMLASIVGWSFAYLRGGSPRRLFDALAMRGLIALHAIRLPLGAVFLWDAAHGRLAATFAERAGFGDIMIGALAIVVAAWGWRQPRIVAAFAIVGLADILLAVATAMYLMFAVADPLMLGALARAPYPLLPFAIVPAVVLTHLLMLARVSKASRHRDPARAIEVEPTP